MERAILMASGLGTRMRPVTDTTPKPLVEVAGRPMVESVIEGLVHRGVFEVSVVVGYLAEQFSYLSQKYPQVRLLENPDYAQTNNISSVRAAAGVLASGDACFVCEADICVVDRSIFDCELGCSCYFGKKVPGHSDDWVFDLDENGWISRVGKGGDDAFNMVGIAYLAPGDAKALAGFVDEAWAQGDREIFWDEVVDRHLDRLRMQVRPVEAGQIREVDTVEELELARREVVWR